MASMDAYSFIFKINSENWVFGAKQNITIYLILNVINYISYIYILRIFIFLLLTIDSKISIV